MRDADCVAFLQSTLPQLRLRWPGFRKVRKQVHKRLARRLTELGLGDLGAYRAHLDQHPEEWRQLDRLCWITISRFYRDRGVFDHLRDHVLPTIAERLRANGEGELRVWSAAGAAGEEAYGLRLIWDELLAARFPTVRLTVVATDSDPAQVRRAREGTYPAGNLKDLPAVLRDAGFSRALASST